MLYALSWYNLYHYALVLVKTFRIFENETRKSRCYATACKLLTDG
jgi:hypothetical protein